MTAWGAPPASTVRAVKPRAAACWVADPTGRHCYRYWDGDGWTGLVLDRGLVKDDPGAGLRELAPPAPAPDRERSGPTTRRHRTIRSRS